jgi:nicotinamidase-related amidase
MKKALLLIDLQNDYFPGGLFPLWNADKILDALLQEIPRAQSSGIEIIHIQHIANPAAGIAPFFNKGTAGAEIHTAILSAAPDAPIVVKEFADSFHTAISKAAEKYTVSILTDCCTTINEPIHLIALHAVSTRVPLLTSSQAF